MTPDTPTLPTVSDLVSLLLPLTDGTSPNARTPSTFLTDGTPDEFPVEIGQIVLMAEDVLILNPRRADPDRCEELRRLTDGRCRAGQDGQLRVALGRAVHAGRPGGVRMSPRLLPYAPALRR